MCGCVSGSLSLCSLPATSCTLSASQGLGRSPFHDRCQCICAGRRATQVGLPVRSGRIFSFKNTFGFLEHSLDSSSKPPPRLYFHVSDVEGNVQLRPGDEVRDSFPMYCLLHEFHHSFTHWCCHILVRYRSDDPANWCLVQSRVPAALRKNCMESVSYVHSTCTACLRWRSQWPTGPPG